MEFTLLLWLKPRTLPCLPALLLPFPPPAHLPTTTSPHLSPCLFMYLCPRPQHGPGAFQPVLPQLLGQPGPGPSASGVLGSLARPDWQVRRAAADCVRCLALLLGPTLEPDRAWEQRDARCLTGLCIRALEAPKFDKVGGRGGGEVGEEVGGERWWEGDVVGEETCCEGRWEAPLWGPSKVLWTGR